MPRKNDRKKNPTRAKENEVCGGRKRKSLDRLTKCTKAFYYINGTNPNERCILGKEKCLKGS